MSVEDVDISEALCALMDESEVLTREIALLSWVVEKLRLEVRAAAERHVSDKAPDLAALLRKSGAVGELLRQTRLTEEAISAALGDLPIVLASGPATALSRRATEALSRRLGHI